MIRSSHVVISRSTVRLARRLARPFSKRKLFRATRVMWPALAALTVTSIAHAQGTMDFSGATTLMTTFNVSTSPVQPQIVFADGREVIAEKAVRALHRQRKRVRNLKQHTQRGMISRPAQVRQEVLGDEFPSFKRVALAVIRRLDLPMQIPQMDQRLHDLGPWNVAIHSEGFSSKNSASEL